MLQRALGVIVLSCLLTLPAGKASAGFTVQTQFNTFNFEAAGPIQTLGPGEGSSQAAMFSTTFDISMGLDGPFQLMVNVAGPGINGMLTDPVLADLVGFDVCLQNEQVYHCTYEDMLTFEPGQIINPGDVFTATGEILEQDNSLTPPVTASDSFVARAAVPAPGALALMAIGLVGLGFSRRRKALQSECRSTGL
jgi:hypothetical protein